MSRRIDRGDRTLRHRGVTGIEIVWLVSSLVLAIFAARYTYARTASVLWSIIGCIGGLLTPTLILYCTVRIAGMIIQRSARRDSGKEEHPQ
jgi:hypothetical protein